MMADAMVDDKGNPLPTKKAGDYPVLRRFTGKSPGRTKYGSEFWEFYKETSKLQNTINFMVDQHQPEIAQKKEQSPAARQADIMKSGYSEVKELQTEIQEIYAESTMTADEKRKAIDEAARRLNKIYKQTVQELK